MPNPKKIIKAVKKVAAKKSETAANKRGLKAANKPVSKDNAYQYGHIGPNSRNKLKNTPPARPNRVRGGSMKSQLNWVDDLMKGLPKAPARTAAEKQRSNKFIEREINKLKNSRGK